MLSKTIVKYIQSLAHKKLRDAHGVFIAEGPKVVSEFLTQGQFECKMVCALPQWIEDNAELIRNLNTIEVNEIELGKISQLQTPNTVLAVLYKKEEEPADVSKGFALMLDDIRDPGNLGTIIRTADWFGIKNIICSDECADCYNPKVVQASMGSLGRMNIVYTDLEKFLHQNSNVKLYAATLSGQDVTKMAIKEGVILIGNESKGIKDTLLERAGAQVTIPRQGEAESLNAAVACGIILSHLVQGNTL